MIEHPDPGPDPLAGLDPHPREHLDVWPLHDARQELLEEIVSQPAPVQSPSKSTRRFALPIGIAAALAVVAGGAWFVGGDDRRDDPDGQVVAANEPPTATATGAPAAEPTQETRRDDVRRRGVIVGRMTALEECARMLRPSDRRELGLRPLEHRQDDGVIRYLVRSERRYLVVVGSDCRVLRVRPDRPQRK